MYSDIWSFGVLMWEVFSFGYQPYFGVENDRVLGGVIGGTLCLQCPPGCPAVVYALMGHCWQKKPEGRIPAAELSKEMLELVQLCKKDGKESVQAMRADCYQTLRKYQSTANGASKIQGTTSEIDVDDGGYLKPGDCGKQNGMDVDCEGYRKPADVGRQDGIGDGYTKVDESEVREYRYETTVNVGAFQLDAKVATMMMDKDGMAKQMSYVDMAGTLPRDETCGSPDGWMNAERLKKQESYMDMANTLPRDARQETKKEAYVDMNSSAPAFGEYDSPINWQQSTTQQTSPVAPPAGVYDKSGDLQTGMHQYVDMGDGQTGGGYDVPVKREMYVDMSGTLPHMESPQDVTLSVTLNDSTSPETAF